MGRLSNEFADKIIIKIDAWFRSGCGQLPRNVSDLDNALAHLTGGGWIGCLAGLSLIAHTHFTVGYVIGILAFLGALVVALYPPIEEYLGHKGQWKRIWKFIRTGDGLTPEEINMRETGGPLDGLTDLWWKSFDGFRGLIGAIIAHIVLI